MRQEPVPTLMLTSATVVAATLLLSVAPAVAAAQPQAAAIDGIRYDVVFNAETASRRELHVEMSFDVRAPGMVALSLPSWTPGSYSLDDYAKNVRNVWARQDGAEIRWDKADFDTWRVYPTSPGNVTVGFDYAADALDTGNAWAQSDFVFFNGTNLFLYPEGDRLDFDSEIHIHTEGLWRVATGLTPGLDPRTYTAESYHELVDMPTFVGRFDLDSLEVGGVKYRLASYPEGALAGESRSVLWDQIERMLPPMEAVFDDTPWSDYTTLLVFDDGFGGGSALEHSKSHLGIYHPNFRLSPTLASITAHEIFHAWNVKRIRPADLWPYDYGRPMPTELLWISEGITDYYADLALVRGGIVGPDFFYATTQEKIDEVRNAPPVALEDASLSAWVGPRDGTGSIYYPKGSLAGLILDVLIRDATDNASSLDDVMRALYVDAYGSARGFTEEEWWAAVREAAGGRSFEDVHDAYIDGREPFPWGEVLPLAGLRLVESTERTPRIGVAMSGSDEGVRVTEVVAGSSAARAGVRAGDVLVSVAGIDASNVNFGVEFRALHASAAAGERYPIVVRRGAQELRLEAELAFLELTNVRVEEVTGADDKALRIRNGLLIGGGGR